SSVLELPGDTDRHGLAEAETGIRQKLHRLLVLEQFGFKQGGPVGRLYPGQRGGTDGHRLVLYLAGVLVDGLLKRPLASNLLIDGRGVPFGGRLLLLKGPDGSVHGLLRSEERRARAISQIS